MVADALLGDISMKYNIKNRKLEISPDDMDRIGNHLLYAMKQIRKIAKLPMDKYEKDSGLTEADHAQKSIINAAEIIGIDLGGTWGHQIDLREIE